MGLGRAEEGRDPPRWWASGQVLRRRREPVVSMEDKRGVRGVAHGASGGGLLFDVPWCVERANDSLYSKIFRFRYVYRKPSHRASRWRKAVRFSFIVLYPVPSSCAISSYR
jgi:hypothetical protein